MDKIYWDSCTWLAYLGKEIIEKPRGLPEDRFLACLDVIEAAKQRKRGIVSSVLSIVEVSRGSSEDWVPLDSFHEVLDGEHFALEPMYAFSGRIAIDLMVAGDASLKIVDSIHLATVIAADVSEFHTYDIELLNLDGKVPRNAGGYLRICKLGESDLQL